MPSRLRPRTVSELVDVEFELLRRHYLSFLTIVAAGFAPVVAVGGVAAVAFGRASTGHAPPTAPMFVVIAVAVLAGLACVAVVQGALIHAASDAYLDDRVNVADAFRRSTAQAPVTVGAYFVMGFLTVLGYLCFFVPGVWAYAGLFAVPAIVLLEGKGPGEAVSRSFALTKGRKLSVLGALVVAAFIAGACRAMLNVGGALSGSTGLAMATQVVSFVALYPVSTVMVVLLYYDARIRSEGFDLERAAMALETAPAPNGASA